MTGLSRTVIELLPYYGFKLVLQNCDKNVSSVRARSPYLPLSHHRIKTDDISCARYRKKCSAQGVLSCQHKSASVATVSDGKQEIKSGCVDVRGNPLQYFGFAPINLKRYIRLHGQAPAESSSPWGFCWHFLQPESSSVHPLIHSTPLPFTINHLYVFTLLIVTEKMAWKHLVLKLAGV